MKRILFCVLLSFVTYSARAESWMLFSAAAVEHAINTFVDSEFRQSAASEYETQMNPETGQISAAGMFSVCVAAGWDIMTMDGMFKCQEFVTMVANFAQLNQIATAADGKCSNFVINDAGAATNAMMCMQLCQQSASAYGCDIVESSTSTGQCVCNPNVERYYAVCGDEAGQTGFAEVCEKDFFAKKRVQMIQAVALAQEHARVKHNDNVKCGGTARVAGDGEYVQCKSTKSDTYYEYRFTKTDATGDNNIVGGTADAICALYDTEYTYAGTQPQVSSIFGTTMQEELAWPAYCMTTDAAVCDKISTSANRFGYRAQLMQVKSLVYDGVACALITPTTETLRTAYNLDPYYFQKTGNSWYLDSDMQTNICTYVKNAIAPISLDSCYCNDSYTQIPESGYNTIYDDDVLTCYLNGQPMDFVFNDLSEAWQYQRDAANQAMNCIVMPGATYTGSQCIGLNRQQCEALAAMDLAECPECAQATWDAENQTCTLPESANVNNLRKGVKLAGGAALMVGGVALTVGTAGKTGKLSVVMVIEGAGVWVTALAENKMSRQAQQFLSEVQHCNDAECAEYYIENNVQRMANLSSRFTDVEIHAIDQELTRLVELLPEDSPIFDSLESVLIADNQLSILDADSWEPEQVWAAIGNTMQMASVLTSIAGLTNSSRALGVRVSTRYRDALMNVANMSDTDRAFYDAYLIYGNRAQTFDEWKLMFDNDVNVMRETVRNWPSWNDVRAGRSAGVAYDTYSPAVSQQTSAVQKIKDNLRTDVMDDMPAWRAVQSQVDSEVNSGLIKNSDEYRRRWDELAQQHGTSYSAFRNALSGEINSYAKYWIEDAVENVPLNNMDFVVAERIDLYGSIIESDANLQRMASNFSDLTDAEKLDFANTILQRSSAQVGVHGGAPTVVQLSSEEISKGLVGQYVTGQDVIKINTNTNLSDFMNGLAHEDAHRIDDWIPQARALGTQNSRLSGMIYTNQPSLGYFDVPTERSSYAVGDAVGNQFSETAADAVSPGN